MAGPLSLKLYGDTALHFASFNRRKLQWHYRKKDPVKSLLNSILKLIILKIYITFYDEFPHAALLEIKRLKLSSSFLVRVFRRGFFAFFEAG